MINERKIKARMVEMGLTQKDLMGLIYCQSKVKRASVSYFTTSRTAWPETRAKRPGIF